MGAKAKPPRPAEPPRANARRRHGALPRLLLGASHEWFNDNAPRLGASVAFYTLLSLAPVIVIAVALAAVLFGPAAAEGRLTAGIQGVAGPEMTQAIGDIPRLTVETGGWLGGREVLISPSPSPMRTGRPSGWMCC
jgi:hypothetical protein